MNGDLFRGQQLRILVEVLSSDINLAILIFFGESILLNNHKLGSLPKNCLKHQAQPESNARSENGKA